MIPEGYASPSITINKAVSEGLPRCRHIWDILMGIGEKAYIRF